jgi:hypothetical protein
MNLKYNIGDEVELNTGKKLTVDTIKINNKGVYYYTQVNNIMYRQDEIKGLWSDKVIDKTPHFIRTAKNASKTKSKSKKVSEQDS